MKMNCGFFWFGKCGQKREREWGGCGENKWEGYHNPCWKPCERPCWQPCERPCERRKCEDRNEWNSIDFYGQIRFRKENKGQCGCNNNFKYFGNQFDYDNVAYDCDCGYPELWQN